MTHTPEPEESEAWNPNSDEQSMAAHMRMTKCLAACAGIPTDKLTPGVVKRLIETLKDTDTTLRRMSYALTLPSNDFERATRKVVDEALAKISPILRELGSE